MKAHKSDIILILLNLHRNLFILFAYIDPYKYTGFSIREIHLHRSDQNSLSTTKMKYAQNFQINSLLPLHAFLVFFVCLFFPLVHFCTTAIFFIYLFFLFITLAIFTGYDNLANME